jgi:hypothetical protein
MGQSYYLAPFTTEMAMAPMILIQAISRIMTLQGNFAKHLLLLWMPPIIILNDPNNWLYGILSDQVIKGDQTLWWVFNDKGNIHTETGGDAIGTGNSWTGFCFLNK